MPETDGFVQPPFAPSCGPVAHGKVYLVGAGPGDPGLITVRGLECLRSADYVLYDGLINSSLLDWAEKAICISVGKHGGDPIWSQSEINAKLVELAQKGATVVRLKGGDPAVFARTAEELAVLSASGIPFEVVPGITAALAAASYVGIPITHRDYASAVALVTGQQQPDAASDIDWGALAKFPGTIVFYMGVTTVAQWSAKLIAAGKAPDTPTAIVRRCSWGDQTVVRCRLDEVTPALTPASKMRPPVIVIVGAVASLGESFDWFSSRPLAGCGVLITRANAQADDMATRLRLMGAEVYIQPVMEISPPEETATLREAVKRLAGGEYRGITFSSVNGIDGLMDTVAAEGFDSRIFSGVTLAAVGAHTAERLRFFGLRADVVPHQFSAADLLAVLPTELSDQRWLVTTTNRGRDTLAVGLTERGALVDAIVTYVSRPVASLKPGVLSALRTGRIRWVTLTSVAIAENAHRLLQEFVDQLAPVSLSQSISEHLQRANWPAKAQATEHSIDSLIEALCAAHSQSTI